MKVNQNKTKILRGFTATGAMLFALFFGASSLAQTYATTLDGFLGTKSYEIVTESGDGEDLYKYRSDYKTTGELVQGLKDLGTQISAEGSTLLKNQKVGAENALPLKSSENKVSLFGVVAYNNFLGGQIGSSIPNNYKPEESGEVKYPNLEHPTITLVSALEEAGIEINPTISKAYQDSGIKPSNIGTSFGVGGSPKTYKINEASVTDIGISETSVEGYSDVGIVVVGRPASESGDFFPDLVTEAGDTQTAKTPLSLSKNELDIIEFAKQNCEKVIVLVNTNHPMEIESLKQDAGVDAIMWIGFPGGYGMRGVVDILQGDANPSGHLTDTYAVDSTSSPAMVNFGVNEWANRDEITRVGDNGEVIDSANLRAVAYEVEAEGIYVGYKYYETRYADKVNGVANVGEYDYTEEVSYGFGYGLSYTDFEQEIESVEWDYNNKTVKATVKVTNVGEVEGKNAVQLYVQTPYTQYDKENLVEKSAIQLIGYGKTGNLGVGKSETVTIEVDAKYFASYDANGAKTYIMDAGDYYFAIGNGAHDALNNVLAKQGKTTANGMDYNGDAEKVEVITRSNLDTETFKYSESGEIITNQLEDGDLNYWMENEVTYLSRQNWTGTWPKAYKGLSANEKMISYLDNRFYDIKTDEEVTTTFGKYQDGITLTFAMMKDVPFDDVRWEYFMDQMTLQEGVEFIANDKKMLPFAAHDAWKEADGPNGITSQKVGLVTKNDDLNNPHRVAEDDPNRGFTCSVMASAPVIAATFSPALMEDWGAMLGNQSLWTNVPFMWAPGANLHRVPYCGRNHEYYSEDSMLANYVATAVVRESAKYGLICGPKHFAFNDMETNRVGLAAFMNEQAAREGELRVFQGCYEDGGCLGMMTSFNRLGCIYVNAHMGLMQGILRGEWSFKGYIVTDMVNGQEYFTPAESIIAGVGMMLGNGKMETEGGYWNYCHWDKIKNDAKLCAAVRENVKTFYYAMSRSHATNGLNESTRVVKLDTWWSTALNVGMIASAVVGGLSALGYILVSIKKKDQ